MFGESMAQSKRHSSQKASKIFQYKTCLRFRFPCRNFEFTLGATAEPDLHPTSERVQANSRAFSLVWRPQSVQLAFDAFSVCGCMVSTAAFFGNSVASKEYSYNSVQCSFQYTRDLSLLLLGNRVLWC